MPLVLMSRPLILAASAMIVPLFMVTPSTSTPSVLEAPVILFCVMLRAPLSYKLGLIVVVFVPSVIETVLLVIVVVLVDILPLNALTFNVIEGCKETSWSVRTTLLVS